MLKDVSITVTDGQIAGPPRDGIHVKIGVSPVEYKEPVVIKNTYGYKRIQEFLGYSPLADACMDSAENGCSVIYCIPVAAVVNGTVGDIEKIPADPALTGSMSIEGNPNNRYGISVIITKGGGLNTAALKYSIDGGVTYSDEVTVPMDGKLQIAQTGLTFVFTNGGSEPAFAPGDAFNASTTAPQTSNEKVLEALAEVRKIPALIEFVHIVGESTKALWAALAYEAENFFSVYFKPIFFQCEARSIADGETVADYVKSLINERKAVNSYFIQVTAARGIYNRMNRTTENINLAGVVCGLYAKATVQQSISETRSFAISSDKLVRLEPEGIEEYLDLLDDAKYLTFRRYEGLDGFYVTKPRVFAPESSDYQYAERVRVLNKAARLVRKEALLQLHRYINIDKQDEELEAIGRFISAPLDNMAENGEISSGYVTIPTDQNILEDEHLHVMLRYVPVGYIREITVDLGMMNPNRRT